MIALRIPTQKENKVPVPNLLSVSVSKEVTLEKAKNDRDGMNFGISIKSQNQSLTNVPSWIVKSTVLFKNVYTHNLSQSTMHYIKFVK